MKYRTELCARCAELEENMEDIIDDCTDCTWSPTPPSKDNNTAQRIMLAPILRQDPIPKPTLEFDDIGTIIDRNLDTHTEVIEEWEEPFEDMLEVLSPAFNIWWVSKDGEQWNVTNNTMFVEKLKEYIRNLIQKASADEERTFHFARKLGAIDGKRELLNKLVAEVKNLPVNDLILQSDDYDHRLGRMKLQVLNLLTSHRGESEIIKGYSDVADQKNGE